MFVLIFCPQHEIFSDRIFQNSELETCQVLIVDNYTPEKTESGKKNMLRIELSTYQVSK